MSGTTGESTSEIIQLLEDAKSYPVNLQIPGSQTHVLDKYAQNLAEQENRLFCHEDAAEVSILSTVGHDLDSYRKAKLCSLEDLIEEFRPLAMGAEVEPSIQFVFIHAPSSREKLKITGTMFRMILAFKRVHHEFLDFCFSFGFHAGRPGFYFGGFRSFHRPQSEVLSDLPFRPGEILQMMYNLKAIEPSGKAGFPYSIRVAAVYHAIDYDKCKATWIIVKGNQVIKDIFEKLSQDRPRPEWKDLNMVDEPLAVTTYSLKSHLTIAEWCVEGWSRYIGHLEQMCETISLNAGTTSVNAEAVIASMEAVLPNRDDDHEARAKAAPAYSASVLDQLKYLFSPRNPKTKACTTAKDVELETASLSRDFQLPSKILIFQDLEQVQDIGEIANEASLVLRSNIEALEKISAVYKRVLRRVTEHNSSHYHSPFGTLTAELLSLLNRLQNDLQDPLTRVAEVATFVAGRKTLLQNRLDFHNIMSQQAAGAKAQLTADRMEKMTRRMNDVAERTEREAVTMRMLTFITVFLLPGAFVSALMSTDIVHFNQTETGAIEKVYSSEALKLYLSMTLPLTTFLLAFVFLYSPGARH